VLLRLVAAVAVDDDKDDGGCFIFVDDQMWGYSVMKQHADVAVH